MLIKHNTFINNSNNPLKFNLKICNHFKKYSHGNNVSLNFEFTNHGTFPYKDYILYNKQKISYAIIIEILKPLISDRRKLKIDKVTFNFQQFINLN